MGKLKRIGSIVLCLAIPFGLLETAYLYGYGRGYTNGSVAMRDAIMCVLERTAGEPPKYCPQMTGPGESA